MHIRSRSHKLLSTFWYKQRAKQKVVTMKQFPLHLLNSIFSFVLWAVHCWYNKITHFVCILSWETETLHPMWRFNLWQNTRINLNFTCNCCVSSNPSGKSVQDVSSVWERDVTRCLLFIPNYACSFMQSDYQWLRGTHESLLFFAALFSIYENSENRVCFVFFLYYFTCCLLNYFDLVAFVL